MVCYDDYLSSMHTVHDVLLINDLERVTVGYGVCSAVLSTVHVT